MDKLQAEVITTYTNGRLAGWYAEVKSSYGVDGEARCEYSELENLFIIKSVEDGKPTCKEIYFYDEYAFSGLDKIFDIWAEM